MKRNQGFTVLELLVVLGIVGLLAAVLTPNLLSARNRANDGAAVGYLRNCVTSVESIRDSLTGKIEINPVSCEDAVLTTAHLIRPGSVKDSRIVVEDLRNSYRIVVTSVTGSVFIHDGYTFTASN